jgi:pyruvate kinase
MMLAGMDVGRLNFSHGNPEELLSRIKLVRLLNAKYHRRIKILGDLQGQRIRVGKLDVPFELEKRKTLWLTKQDIKGTQTKIPFDYRGSLQKIKNGQYIFIDDGNIALEVIGRTENSLKIKVLVGGLLKSYKGVNIPGARLEFGKISHKDKQDILFCEKNGIEYIAQSFVRTKKDILDVRKFLSKGSRCRVVAKIENREGIKNIDQIIKVADGIMIARGDMGVSLPIYEIPVIQKMLESMTKNLRPTRAEVTDVANAIIDGSDFVMLSAETAVGKYPVQTVRMMNNIIKFTEKSYLIKNKKKGGAGWP